MWPINYENPHKLHMSLGIGLLVAGFILILSTLLHTQNLLVDSMDSIRDEILAMDEKVQFQANQIELLNKILQDKNKFIMDNTKSQQSIGYILCIFGLIALLIGYVPFSYKYFKKKN